MAKQLQRPGTEEMEDNATDTEATPEKPVFTFYHGSAGFAFVLKGRGFGWTVGALLIDGKPPTQITVWGDDRIKGTAPLGARKKTPTISVNGETLQYEAPPPPVVEEE